MNGESTLRRAAMACVLAVVAGSYAALAQTQEPKPAPAAEPPRADKAKPAPQPPRGDRGARKRDAPGEERPRPDIPVSFPVDI